MLDIKVESASKVNNSSILDGQNASISGVYLGSMRNNQPANNGGASRGIILTPQNLTQPLLFPFTDHETGEVFICVEGKNGALKQYTDPVENRLEKFILQSAAKHLLPSKRVSKCCRLRAYGQNDIQVLHNPALKTAHYGGLQTCGSVWDDPICAAKISERRRVEEVLPAMNQWKDQGGQCLLLTLTHPHNMNHVLIELLKGEQKALSSMSGARVYRALMQSIGFIGSIRAWEVTYGFNGFHPHFHFILFVRIDLDLVSLEDQFYLSWANACRLAKLPIPDREHGVSLEDGTKADFYVSKGLWSLDHEITKGHLKKSNKGRSPMDLLRSYTYDHDKQAGALFVEYSNAFHGKRQLHWSKGLKDYFSIGEKTDEEVAGEQDERAILLGRIDWPVWQLVLKSEMRGDILELGRSGSWEAIQRLLDFLIKNDSLGVVK